MMRRRDSAGRFVASLAVAVACACVAAAAGAAPSALPQQAGVVDLLTGAHLRIDGPARGHYAGAIVASGDVNGDGRTDVVVDTSTGASITGETHVVFGGSSTGPTRDLAAAGDGGFRIHSNIDLPTVKSVSLADVNGDGRADLLLGMPNLAPSGRTNAGGVYVVFGKTSATPVNLGALGDGGFRIEGAAPVDFAGVSVAGVGDMNGDGRAEVVVGAPSADEDRGTAYVVFGKASTTNVDLASLGNGGFEIQAGADLLFTGEAVAGTGDVNGDGRPDVVVGSPSADPPGRLRAGAAFVVFGKASSAPVALASLGGGGFRIDGAVQHDAAGKNVAGVGDVNGDGRADVVVGAPSAGRNGRSQSGSAHVVFGKATGTTVDLAALGDSGFHIDGAVAHDRAGEALSGAGDVNGDGRPDVLVGAQYADNSGRATSGSAYVVYGRASSASVDLAALGAGGFRMDGAVAGYQAGAAVSGAGDWNGDGRPDVVVGVPNASYNLRQESGSAYVVLGFGAPALEYGRPLTATVRSTLKAHAPTRIERTGSPTFQAAPPLPAGLRFDAAGAVVGTPTAAKARTEHTVTMRDLVGQATASLVVTVLADRTKPGLAVRAASPQRPLRGRRVVVRARCNEACTLRAGGTIVISGGSRRIPLRAASAKRATTTERRLALVLTASARKRLAGVLGQGRRARVRVTVRAVDLSGNARTATRTISVRR
jgi:FG-GAP repeat/Putative Ig domain